MYRASRPARVVRRALLLVALAMGAVVATASAALAVWSSGGSGTGSATTGTLNPPTNVTASNSPGSGSVSLGWTASSISSAAVAPSGYYVQRVDNSSGRSTNVCGTSAANTTTSTSCIDSGVGSGSYHYTVTAVYNSWTAVASSGNITINVAMKLAFTTQPAGGTARSTLPSIAVSIEDANNNPVAVAGTQVTVALGANPGGGTLSGTRTVTTNATGVATFADLSIDKAGNGYTLTASGSGLTGATSAAFNITAGSANKLVFVQQPTNATAGAAISPGVSVQVQDANGNVVPSSASISVAIGTNPSSGTLSGTKTVFAVNGTATFNDLSIDKAGTGYTLTTSGAGLTSATSAAFNVTTGAASKLVFVQQPTSTTAVAAISPPVTVQVQDASGNVVSSNASITVAIGTNPSSGTLSGTKTVSAVNGTATFSGLSIDKPGTGYTLTASSAGLTGATSAAFNVTAGAANKLVFVQQPTNATAGAAISPAVTVQVQDANGNVVADSTASISVAIGSNPGSGTLSGTKTVSAVNGTATFNGLTIDKAGTGYTLTASSTGLAGATSAAFNITPAAVSITKVDPGTQKFGTSSTFTITGAGFQTGASVTASTNATTSNATVVSPTTITVTVTNTYNNGNGNKTIDLTVTNPDGGSVTKTGAISITN